MPLAVDLDRADSIAKHPLGGKYEDPLNGATYRYIKNKDHTTVAGQCVVRQSDVAWEVTNDFSDSHATLPVGVGLVQIILTDGQYGWMQTGGYNRVAIPHAIAATLAEGLAIVADTANDGNIDQMADGEEDIIIGYSLATVANSTACPVGDAFINIE